MDPHDSLVRHLTNTVRCSVCGASYRPDDVSVLGHQDELWFITVACKSCSTQGLIAALVRDAGDATLTPEQGAAGAFRPAEMAETDDARARNAAPITEGDVAEMRAFLKGFRGGMRELLDTG
jgi:hypothetical protein